MVVRLRDVPSRADVIAAADAEPTHCPDCGSELSRDDNALKGYAGLRMMTPVTILACSGCEYVFEVA